MKNTRNLVSLPLGILLFVGALSLSWGCQETKPLLYYVEVSSPSFLFSDSGTETQTLYVSANYKWTIDDVPEWLQVTPLSGEAGDRVPVTVRAMANGDFHVRQASLTLSAGDKRTSVQVTQAPCGADLQGGIYLFAPSDTLFFPSALSERALPVLSNGTWTARVEAVTANEAAPTWLSCRVEATQLVLQAAPHTGDDPRHAAVVLEAGTGTSGSEKGARQRVVVVQEYPRSGGVEPSQVVLTSNQQAFTVQVHHNYGVSPVVTPQVDWIAYTGCVQTKGREEYELSFTARVNVTFEQRTGEVFVALGDSVHVLSVVQAANNLEDEVPVEDAAFKAYLLSRFDSDQNGVFTKEEAKAVVDLDCNDLGIRSMQGIAFMPNLEYIYCRNNDLTEIDLQNNLHLSILACDNNRLETCLLPNPSVLEYIWCSSNQLTALDLKGMTSLSILHCNNNRLTALDLGECPKLRTLNASNNALRTLDLRPAPYLEQVDCSNNGMETLQAGAANALLTRIYCSSNAFPALSLEGLPKLEYVHFIRNQVPGTLSVARCPALVFLACQDALLSQVEVSDCQALQSISCEGNKLTSLKLKGLPSLTDLDANTNSLTYVEGLDECVALKTLSLGTNLITQLNVASLTQLESLSVDSNKITQLDLTGLSALRELTVYDNPLPKLQLEPCPRLEKLDVGYSPMTEIDLTPCPYLRDLSVSETSIIEIDLSPCPLLQHLSITDTPISDVALHLLPELLTFYCPFAPNIKTLDFSHNPKLETLSCLGCDQLTYVDASQCPHLSVLWCYDCPSLCEIRLAVTPEELFQYSTWGDKVYVNPDGSGDGGQSGAYYYLPAIYVNGKLASVIYEE